MNLQQCLKILELETIGSRQDAKRTYKDLVRVWHPDRFQRNPRLKQKADQKLREINLAYKYLLDYIESNQAGGLSLQKTPPSKSPSGSDVASYTQQSGDLRSGGNSRTRAEIKTPGINRCADPAAKAQPRTSSSGRYVLLAFLCVVVAISALVVYFLSDTGKVVSKTMGMASEALEEIADKLEKNEAIPKNDSSVRGIVHEMDRAARDRESMSNFEIHLDSGTIIMTELWWEESDMIMYRVDGGSMGIERSRVQKIVKR